MIDVPARPISPCWEARTEDGEVVRFDVGALELFGIGREAHRDQGPCERVGKAEPGARKERCVGVIATMGLPPPGDVFGPTH